MPPRRCLHYLLHPPECKQKMHKSKEKTYTSPHSIFLLNATTNKTAPHLPKEDTTSSSANIRKKYTTNNAPPPQPNKTAYKAPAAELLRLAQNKDRHIFKNLFQSIGEPWLIRYMVTVPCGAMTFELHILLSHRIKRPQSTAILARHSTV